MLIVTIRMWHLWLAELQISFINTLLDSLFNQYWSLAYGKPCTCLFDFDLIVWGCWAFKKNRVKDHMNSSSLQSYACDFHLVISNDSQNNEFLSNDLVSIIISFMWAVVQATADGTCAIRLPQTPSFSPPSSSSSSAAAAASIAPAAGATSVSRSETYDRSAIATPLPYVQVPQSGYVSSYVTSRSGCGTVDRPWLLRADQGQRIRLTLFDFSLLPSPSGSAANSDWSQGGATDSQSSAIDHQAQQQQQQQQVPGTVCLVYAVVREPAVGGQTRTVCGGRVARDELVMISTGNAVDLRLVGKKLNNKDRTTRPGGNDDVLGSADIENFMIGYQCTYSAETGLLKVERTCFGCHWGNCDVSLMLLQLKLI